jgi:uncharacterized protein with HEPN domain
MIRRRLRTYHTYLSDVQQSIEQILTYSKGMSFSEFCKPGMRRDAILFNFQIMGEAVKHVPRHVQSKNKNLPWNYMAALRNDITHEYFDPDDEIVWSIVQVDLEHNLEDIKKLLKQLS